MTLKSREDISQFFYATLSHVLKFKQVEVSGQSPVYHVKIISEKYDYPYKLCRMTDTDWWALREARDKSEGPKLCDKKTLAGACACIVEDVKKFFVTEDTAKPALIYATDVDYPPRLADSLRQGAMKKYPHPDLDDPSIVPLEPYYPENMLKPCMIHDEMIMKPLPLTNDSWEKNFPSAYAQMVRLIRQANAYPLSSYPKPVINLPPSELPEMTMSDCVQPTDLVPTALKIIRDMLQREFAYRSSDIKSQVLPHGSGDYKITTGDKKYSYTLIFLGEDSKGQHNWLLVNSNYSNFVSLYGSLSYVIERFVLFLVGLDDMGEMTLPKWSKGLSDELKRQGLSSAFLAISGSPDHMIITINSHCYVIKGNPAVANHWDITSRGWHLENLSGNEACMHLVKHYKRTVDHAESYLVEVTPNAESPQWVKEKFEKFKKLTQHWENKLCKHCAGSGITHRFNIDTSITMLEEIACPHCKNGYVEVLIKPAKTYNKEVFVEMLKASMPEVDWDHNPDLRTLSGRLGKAKVVFEIVASSTVLNAYLRIKMIDKASDTIIGIPTIYNREDGTEASPESLRAVILNCISEYAEAYVKELEVLRSFPEK